MPNVQSFRESVNTVLKARYDRTSRVDEVALPHDLCVEVSDKCEAEAKKVKAAKVKLVAELSKCEAELETARGREAETYDVSQVKQFKGDFLEMESLREVTRPVYRKSAKTIQFEQQVVRPIRERIRRLQASVQTCDQELAELRRLNKAAWAGDVALIHHLSAKWRTKLLIGPALIGELPRQLQEAMPGDTLYVDAAGNPLPQEALDKNTQAPDLPVPLSGGRAPR